ncbi:hypothetical protein GGF50DRAFT_16315, partial [Schizophyllum commune]
QSRAGRKEEREAPRAATPTREGKGEQEEDRGEEERPSSDSDDALPFANSPHWVYPPGPKEREEEEEEPQAHLLVQLKPELAERFRKGYQADAYFNQHYIDKENSAANQLTPSRFSKSADGLLYFIDADWQARLCVPSSEVNYVLRTIHNNPYEAAHAG